MEAPLINLISASDLIGINHTELLRKCQEAPLPIYYSPPSSLKVWEFKSISDDPAHSFWAKVSPLSSQTLYSRSPIRKRYQYIDLPPRTLNHNCYFNLGDAEITGLLQKGSIETSGFNQFYQLDGRIMKPGGQPFPSEEELVQFEKQKTKSRQPTKLTPLSIGYKQEFYGLAPTELKPTKRKDLPPIAINYDEIWIERDKLAQFRHTFTPSAATIILEVFPELKGAIDADNCQNQIPSKLAAVLSVCIQAWKRCQPGLTLKSEAEWVKSTLRQQPDIKFGNETLAKICTLYTTGFEYSLGDQSHLALTEPSRAGSSLIKAGNLPLSSEIRKSGLLVLVGAWIEHYQKADLWDDSNKKPDATKGKAIRERANAFLEAYLTGKLARHMLLILQETTPWQDNAF